MRRSFPLRRPRFFVIILGTTAILAATAPASGADAPPHCGRLHEALWACRYNGPGNDVDTANAVQTSPDGSVVYVTGASASFTFNAYSDYATIAYSADTGQPLWLSRYNGPRDSGDDAFALGTSPDGSSVFVTGQSFGDSWYDYATVSYDAATGTQGWVARHPDGQARALAVSPDGSVVFVTGLNAADGSALTIAYDAATGGERWLSTYTGFAYSDARSVGVSPDGSRVFITATSDGDFATIAYDAASGDQLWATRYDGPGNGPDTVYALAVSPDGSEVVVTGTDYSLDSYQDSRPSPTLPPQAISSGSVATLHGATTSTRPGPSPSTRTGRPYTSPETPGTAPI